MKTTRSIFTRDFILAFCAQLVFMSVFQLLIPTLPIYLKKLGSTEIEIGILVGTLGIASVGFRPLVGKILAKVREKAVTMVGAGLFALCSMAYIVVPLFWPFLLVRVFQGIAFGSFHTASLTYVVSMSGTANRARILGYFALTMNFAGAIAPPLGIILANRFGFNYLFLVCTALSLCVILVSAMLGRSPATTLNSKTKDDGLLLSRPAFPPSIINFMVLFCWSSLSTFFPLYATTRGMANPGLFFTVMAIMLILGRTVGGRILDVSSKRGIVLPCICLWIISMAVLSLSKTQPMFLLTAVLWGAGHAYLTPTLMALALERAGSSPSPVVATFYAVSDLGVFLGPLIMGVVIHYAGYPFMFLCLALMGVAGFIYFWWFTSKKRPPC